MRGRRLVAALVASVTCFAALGASVVVAQTRSVNPQAKTEAAAESPPDLLSGETPDYVPKASAQPTAAPKEVAPTPNASPVVASIRARLAELRKTSSSDELVALEEFYNGRDAALWMTDMGFSSEALAAIDEMLRAEDWGLSSAAFEQRSAHTGSPTLSSSRRRARSRNRPTKPPPTRSSSISPY